MRQTALFFLCGAAMAGRGNLLVILQRCAPPNQIGLGMGAEVRRKRGGISAPVSGYLIGRTAAIARPRRATAD